MQCMIESQKMQFVLVENIHFKYCMVLSLALLCDASGKKLLICLCVFIPLNWENTFIHTSVKYTMAIVQYYSCYK